MLSDMVEVSKLDEAEPESMTVLLRLPILLSMLEELSMANVVELPSLSSIELEASEGSDGSRLDLIVKTCALLAISAVLMSLSDAAEGDPGAEYPMGMPINTPSK